MCVCARARARMYEREKERERVLFQLMSFLSVAGNLSRDVGANLPMLNLTENWAHMSAGGHGMLQSQAAATQGQYGMWMSSAVGNLSPNQNCAMPYLRSTAPYSLPTCSPSVTSNPSIPTPSITSQTGYDHPCDISYSSAGVRENARSNWSPLTPPPL